MVTGACILAIGIGIGYFFNYKKVSKLPDSVSKIIKDILISKQAKIVEMDSNIDLGDES